MHTNSTGKSSREVQFLAKSYLFIKSILLGSNTEFCLDDCSNLLQMWLHAITEWLQQALYPLPIPYIRPTTWLHKQHKHTAVWPCFTRAGQEDTGLRILGYDLSVFIFCVVYLLVCKYKISITFSYTVLDYFTNGNWTIRGQPTHLSFYFLSNGMSIWAC